MSRTSAYLRWQLRDDHGLRTAGSQDKATTSQPAESQRCRWVCIPAPDYREHSSSLCCTNPHVTWPPAHTAVLTVLGWRLPGPMWVLTICLASWDAGSCVWTESRVRQWALKVGEWYFLVKTQEVCVGESMQIHWVTPLSLFPLLFLLFTIIKGWLCVD